MRRLLHLPLSCLVLALALCPAPALAGGYALRVVEPGETLAEIASLYGLPVDALMEANGLDDALLQPGQRLRVPLQEATGGAADAAPEPPPDFLRHVLAPGETLSEVVERYDIGMKALVGANPDLSSLDRLPAGVELLIPPREGLLVRLEPGEPLTELLRRHDADPVQVLRANRIDSPAQIRPGMLVFLPGVEPHAALERLAEVRERENRYLWPVHGRITSYYGRRNLGLGTANFHEGIDVAAPTGTPVAAARSGTVVFAGWASGGYGYMVRIRHAGHEESYYAHLSAIHASVGQHVEQGTVIGRIGSTGLSTGPHLHFEIHKGGRAQDPLVELR